MTAVRFVRTCSWLRRVWYTLMRVNQSYLCLNFGGSVCFVSVLGSVWDCPADNQQALHCPGFFEGDVPCCCGADSVALVAAYYRMIKVTGYSFCAT